jgi:hypothetical protein
LSSLSPGMAREHKGRAKMVMGGANEAMRVGGGESCAFSIVCDRWSTNEAEKVGCAADGLGSSPT